MDCYVLPKEPLWKVMHDAMTPVAGPEPRLSPANETYDDYALRYSRALRAAELRAVADYINSCIYSDQPVQAVIEMLLEEADAAEAGA